MDKYLTDNLENKKIYSLLIRNLIINHKVHPRLVQYIIKNDILDYQNMSDILYYISNSSKYSHDDKSINANNR